MFSFCHFSASKPLPAPAPVRPTSSMLVMVTISVPEIVMIEDQSNHETNALVLYVSYFCDNGTCLLS